MDPGDERWERIKALFDAACELQRDQRAAFLPSQSEDPLILQEVEALLRNHDEAGDFLSVGVLERRPTFFAPSVRFSPGDVLAERFKIIKFIAAGGMGEVYEAEDLDLR